MSVCSWLVFVMTCLLSRLENLHSSYTSVCKRLSSLSTFVCQGFKKWLFCDRLLNSSMLFCRRNVWICLSFAGTNACYVETLSNIDKFKMKYFSRTPEMVVNIEWPGFKSRSFDRLQEDIDLDAESHKPGDQAFEKLTSGLYMGEIARRILNR